MQALTGQAEAGARVDGVRTRVTNALAYRAALVELMADLSPRPSFPQPDAAGCWSNERFVVQILYGVVADFNLPNER